MIFMLNCNTLICYDIVDENFLPDTGISVFAYDAKTSAPKVNAAAAVVIDMESGRVLFDKNAHSKRAMASTTKIMTGIIAIEKGRPDDLVTISKRAASIGGSSFKIREGEKYTLNELLYGLLLVSGNDASIAIAEHIGGTVEGFSDMMNEKARLIGAKNTCFKTPHGLDAKGHYSTAYDMAVIAGYALKNPLFSEIVSTRYASVHGKNLKNTNEMLELYRGADGVKTGYTGKAGRCLVTSATRENSRYIAVVLYCSSKTQRMLSSKKILDYAFETYKGFEILEQGTYVADIPVIKGKDKAVEAKTAENVSLQLSDEEYAKLKKNINIIKNVDAPVYAGMDLGTVSYALDGEVVAQTKIKAWHSVGRKSFWDYIKQMLILR